MMALSVQMTKVHNYLTNEDIVIPRLVNQQTLDFNGLCEYLADGSTVTAADVAAVMKQIESRLPLVLGLNAKVICSPEGLTFKPKVSGSITQKQLKEKLQARLEADPTLDIDVNRELTVSDLTISDINAANVAGVKYVNLAGQTSNVPFDGVNLVVTTYSDGTQNTVKTVK